MLRGIVEDADQRRSLIYIFRNLVWLVLELSVTHLEWNFSNHYSAFG